jgi:hypothetical protein
MIAPPHNSPEPTAVPSDRSFGAEADGGVGSLAGIS